MLMYRMSNLLSAVFELLVVDKQQSVPYLPYQSYTDTSYMYISKSVGRYQLKENLLLIPN